MDPSLIAVLAVLASLAQVVLLRIIDYYFPRGATRIGDRIAQQRAAKDPNYDYDPDEHDNK